MMVFNAKAPRVSIVMPVYNSEKYVGIAIDSVLSQTMPEWELIIVDDASTDASRTIIQQYSHDSRVVILINEMNQGVSESRNKAICAASAEWVAFLDSDDEWLPDKLEKQFAAAEEFGAGFVFTGTQYSDTTGNRSSYCLVPNEKVSFKDLLKQNVISCSSVLIRKDLLDGLRMPGDEMHEDYAMWLKVLKRIDYALAVREPLLIHRIHRESKSSNKGRALMMNMNTYKYVGVSPFRALYSTMFYVSRNLDKYRKIDAGFASKE